MFLGDQPSAHSPAGIRVQVVVGRARDSDGIGIENIGKFGGGDLGSGCLDEHGQGESQVESSHHRKRVDQPNPKVFCYFYRSDFGLSGIFEGGDQVLQTEDLGEECAFLYGSFDFLYQSSHAL